MARGSTVEWRGWTWLVLVGATLVVGACDSQDEGVVEDISAPSVVVADSAAPVTAEPVSAEVVESTTSAADSAVGSGAPSALTTVVAPVEVAPVAPRPSVEALADIVLEVTSLASFEFPTGGAFGPSGDFYVVGQLGPVWRMDAEVLDSGRGGDVFVEPVEFGADNLVLDLSLRTSVVEAASSERGVLGVAFHPIDQRMYVSFTDVDGNNVVASWELANGVAVESSERLVLTVDQPGPGHNGGGITFASDGTMFIGIGDGGASNGDDARDLTNLLGTVVRIVPRLDGPGYDIPADNPFVEGIGPGGGDASPEIWAFGFRNPWRLFLDNPTGDLWVADVGNNTTEELNVVSEAGLGRDYGWNAFEGTRAVRNRETFEPVDPIYEWGRDIGYASVGGVVYRSSRLPGLDGAVVFGDLSGSVMLLGSVGAEPAGSVSAVVLDPGVPGLVSLHVSPTGHLLGLVIWGELVRFDVAG